MTISEYKAKLAGYMGDVRCPADFETHWRAKAAMPVLSVNTEKLLFENSAAIYEKLTLSYEAGEIKARVIRPNRAGRHPLMLMFHDLHRGVRGWHHMTRFIALGYCVIALEAEPNCTDWIQNPGQMHFADRYQQALILANYAASLPHVDTGKIAAWGEGFGGGLAVAVSAFGPENIRCIALHPFPADIRSICKDRGGADFDSLDYVDLANFAPYLKSPALFGVCLMDEVAKPEGQYAIYNRLACPYTLKVYPKYIHERVNFFENVILNFLKDHV